MQVQNSLARSVSQNKRNYDEACKRILAEKQVRARILKDYVGEFEGLSLEAIELLLDGKVEIGAEPVGRDERAAYLAGTVGNLNVEDSTVEEGTARFDIRFSVPIPDGNGSVVVEIDLEAQNKWNVGYSLPSRAVFYCARMISAQGGRVLPESNYNKLHKVYSLWVCSRPGAGHRGVVEHFSIFPWSDKGSRLFDGYDLMEVCFVCLDGNKASAEYGCLGMLSALFAQASDPNELKRTLAKEFGMIMSEEVDERVETMCNFSEGIWEDGWNEGRDEGRAEGLAEGRAEGRAESLANIMRNMSLSLEAAMNAMGIPAEEKSKYEALIASQS